VVSPTDSGMKDLRRGGDRADKQMIAPDPPIHVGTVHTHEASVLDVSLVLGQRGKTVNRNTICCLLADCLHDV
jgi:hypothetical protein